MRYLILWLVFLNTLFPAPKAFAIDYTGPEDIPLLTRVVETYLNDFNIPNDLRRILPDRVVQDQISAIAATEIYEPVGRFMAISVSDTQTETNLVPPVEVDDPSLILSLSDWMMFEASRNKNAHLLILVPFVLSPQTAVLSFRFGPTSSHNQAVLHLESVLLAGSFEDGLRLLDEWSLGHNGSTRLFFEPPLSSSEIKDGHKTPAGRFVFTFQENIKSLGFYYLEPRDDGSVRRQRAPYSESINAHLDRMRKIWERNPEMATQAEIQRLIRRIQNLRLNIDPFWASRRAVRVHEAFAHAQSVMDLLVSLEKSQSLETSKSSPFPKLASIFGLRKRPIRFSVAGALDLKDSAYHDFLYTLLEISEKTPFEIAGYVNLLADGHELLLDFLDREVGDYLHRHLQGEDVSISRTGLDEMRTEYFRAVEVALFRDFPAETVYLITGAVLRKMTPALKGPNELAVYQYLSIIDKIFDLAQSLRNLTLEAIADRTQVELAKGTSSGVPMISREANRILMGALPTENTWLETARTLTPESAIQLRDSRAITGLRSRMIR